MRGDPAFRYSLLSQSLDILLAELQKLRNAPSARANATQIRRALNSRRGSPS